ncbi:CaiB/BaiF CoA transferase family protein [Maricaulis salignorans]|uniref:Alpha-methylacyl-CoA racemase n=1 Tax=Maricaulis salignorans TaxID=144026 RepID=A0A1G9P5Z5_9PROT|nr:CaiB/BaiF CoA-transferase family protein [Maricaulis salignorans]SDL94228.1 alpha-methylacyl-CoA racemase [Maricaulis salignorans]
MKAQGPLKGVKVLEFVGLGPAPFCAMMLADMGADVVRIDRPGAHGGGASEVLARGRRSISLNMKDEGDLAICRDLISKAEILIEGFRPGVMERLGLGPDAAFGLNPALVYGRMTGWGQTGPLAQAAGHDINYISLTGALGAIGTTQTPVPPLNLVGDFGGGAMYLAFGVLAGLLHARATGEGQVVDAAIVDGATSLMASQHQLAAMGLWNTRRGENLLDGGAHFYGVYACADGGHVSIGPLEPQFYAQLMDKLGIDPASMPPSWTSEDWAAAKARLAAIFLGKTRDEWCALLEGSDVCFAPVLNYEESPDHPHMAQRGVYVEIDGVRQAAPAPRFSRTPGAVQGAASKPGADRDAILADWNASG